MFQTLFYMDHYYFQIVYLYHSDNKLQHNFQRTNQTQPRQVQTKPWSWGPSSPAASPSPLSCSLAWLPSSYTGHHPAPAPTTSIALAPPPFHVFIQSLTPFALPPAHQPLPQLPVHHPGHQEECVHPPGHSLSLGRSSKGCGWGKLQHFYENLLLIKNLPFLARFLFGPLPPLLASCSCILMAWCFFMVGAVLIAINFFKVLLAIKVFMCPY